MTLDSWLGWWMMMFIGLKSQQLVKSLLIKLHVWRKIIQIGYNNKLTRACAGVLNLQSTCARFQLIGKLLTKSLGTMDTIWQYTKSLTFVRSALPSLKVPRLMVWILSRKKKSTHVGKLPCLPLVSQQLGSRYFSALLQHFI